MCFNSNKLIIQSKFYKRNIIECLSTTLKRKTDDENKNCTPLYTFYMFNLEHTVSFSK